MLSGSELAIDYKISLKPNSYLPVSDVDDSKYAFGTIKVDTQHRSPFTTYINHQYVKLFLDNFSDLITLVSHQLTTV